MRRDNDIASISKVAGVLGSTSYYNRGVKGQHQNHINHSSSEQVVVCIDGSNLFYAALQLGIEIDYTKLLEQVVGNRRLLRAYFYTGADSNNQKQQKFLLWMRRNGYRVITKEIVTLSDGSHKANLDVEMAVDMLQFASHCDSVVLISGDGNLSYAVERASEKGSRFEIISLRSMTSESLLNVADDYTNLADIAPFISLRPHQSTPSTSEFSEYQAS